VDRRRQPPATTAPGVVRLGKVAARLPTLDVACNRCDRRGRMNTAAQVAEHGADMPVPVLLRTIAADCPRMQAAQLHDGCGVHLPQLSQLVL
jgi:hypothetical protein